MKNFGFLILIVWFFTNAICAQNNGVKLSGEDAALYRQGSVETERCLVYKNYVVKTANDKTNGGEAFKVFQRQTPSAAKAACEQTETDPLLDLSGNYTGKNASINEDITSVFFGLSGKYLFVDKVVEPFVGEFEIFDLTTRKSIFKNEYYERIKLLQHHFVDFDQWSAKDGLLKNCSQAKKWKKDGLGIGWIQQKRLDLQTLKLQNIGALRCEAQQ